MSVVASAAVVALVGWAGVAFCAGGPRLPETINDSARDTEAAGKALAPATGDMCTPFSREASLFATPVGWRYRICDLASAEYRLEVQFRNGASAPVSFSYRGWLRNPERCSTRGAGAPVIAGRSVLLRKESGAVAHASARIAPADYTGRLWLCISEIEGVGVLRRLAYVLPCRRLHARLGSRTPETEP